jgi:hypothetical protein
MAAKYIQAGAVGMAITLTVRDQDEAIVDLTTATTTQILLKPPQGFAITKTATVVSPSTSGQVRYVTEAGVLGVPGRWKAQAFVVLAGGNEYYSTTIDFVVGANL